MPFTAFDTPSVCNCVSVYLYKKWEWIFWSVRVVRGGDRGRKEGDCNGEEVLSTLAPPSWHYSTTIRIYPFTLATLHRMQIMSVEGGGRWEGGKGCLINLPTTLLLTPSHVNWTTGSNVHSTTNSSRNRSTLGGGEGRKGLFDKSTSPPALLYTTALYFYPLPT